MASQYHSLFTTQGLELLREAIQNGTKLGITHMSYGDGNGYLPVPDAAYTQMVKEVYRTQLNRLAPSKENANWLEADGIIPSAVGGFNIREVALWAGNVMVAYANYPPTYKPTADQGTAQIKTIRIVLQIDNTANFELKIDASVVMATIQSVEEAKNEVKQLFINNSPYNPILNYFSFSELSAYFTKSLNDLIEKISLNGGGTITIPDGTFIIDPEIGIEFKNNIGLRLGKNTVLKARKNGLDSYQLLRIHDVENVSIEGGFIDGNKQESTATSGEWGMGISVRGSKNISLRDVEVNNCWGDSLYIGRTKNKDCTDGLIVENFKANGSRRQGISIVSLKNASLKNIKIRDISGTAPSAGLDFEPNKGDEWLYNIVLENIDTENCNGGGIHTYYGMLGWQDWRVDKTFKTGHVVKKDELFYIALSNNSGVDISDSIVWKEIYYDQFSERINVTVGGHVDSKSNRGFYSLGSEVDTKVKGIWKNINCKYSAKDQYCAFNQNNSADGLQIYYKDCTFENDNTTPLNHIRISNAPADYSLGGVHVIRPKFISKGVKSACMYVYANNLNGLPNKNISLIDIVEITDGLFPFQMISRESENIILSDKFKKNRLNTDVSNSINEVSIFDEYYTNSNTTTFNINSFKKGKIIKIVNENNRKSLVNLNVANTNIVGMTNDLSRTIEIGEQGFLELFALSNTKLIPIRHEKITRSSKRRTGLDHIGTIVFAANETKLVKTINEMDVDQYSDVIAVSTTVQLNGQFCISTQVTSKNVFEIYMTNLTNVQKTIQGNQHYFNISVL